MECDVAFPKKKAPCHAKQRRLIPLEVKVINCREKDLVSICLDVVVAGKSLA